MAWLPKLHYPRVQLCCVLPACHETAEVGIAFEDARQPEPLRLRLSLDDARALCQALLRDQRLWGASGVQSPTSSGRPSVEGSVVPGQSQ